MKIFRVIFSLLLLIPISHVWAQNPVVSLAGGPCTGSTLTVTSSITPTQIVWKQNGAPVATNTSTTYVAASAGSYTATVTTANGSATTNAVTITALTTPSIVITPIPSSTNICAGTNVNLSATATFTGSAPTYQWKKNGTPVGSNSSIFSINTLANGDVISCTLTSNDPCASPATASSNNVTYTINTPVTPSVSIAVAPGTSICGGTSVTFTATPVNGGSTPAYQWYVNGSAVAAATNSTFTTTTLNNNDSVYCKMVTSVACPTVETVQSNSFTMTVSTSVTPSISITVNPGSTVCAGTPLTFSSSNVNAGSSPQYQWYKNGVAVTGATSSTFSTSAIANHDSITCTMTSNAACATAASVTSAKISMTVNPVGTPFINITAQNGDSVCVNDTVVFTATSTFGGSTPLYTWIKNGTVLANLSTLNHISLTGVNNNDTVSCMLTSNQVCATTTTANSNKLLMSVFPHQTMTLSITANPGTNITSGTVVIFSTTVTNAGSSYNYQWYINGTAVAGSISPTFSTNTLANQDVVTCKVTSNQPCVIPHVITSNAITMNVANGVKKIGVGSVHLDLYPNPNTGSFTVQGSLPNDKKTANLEVVNVLGQVIYKAMTDVHSGLLNQQINLLHLPAGMYLLKVRTTDVVEQLKFNIR